MNILSIRYLPFSAVFLAVFSTLILSGCSPFRTKTIWKSIDKPNIKLSRIGFSQLANEEDIDKLVDGSGKNYKFSMMDYFLGSETKVEKLPLPGFTSISSIDGQEIAKICQKNYLDAYICTEIRYLFVTYETATLIGNFNKRQSEDIFIEQIIFDRNGDPLMYVQHNTFSGPLLTYFSFRYGKNLFDPIQYDGSISKSKRTISEGVRRCLRRIERRMK